MTRMMITVSTQPGSARQHKGLWAAVLLGLLVMLNTPLLHAASADDTSEGPTDSAETTPAEPSGDAPASEVFIPTEEISEDFAVSFPVDI